MNELIFYGVFAAVTCAGVKLYSDFKNSIIIKKSDWKKVEDNIRKNEREKVLEYVRENK